MRAVLGIGFWVLALTLAHAESRVAGGVVQSDEWIIRREVKEEEFKGNVRFDHGPDHVSADWALYQKTLELWTVRGHLYANRRSPKGEFYEVWGQNAKYDMRTKDGQGDGGKSPIRFRRSFEVDGATLAWNGTAGKARWVGASKQAFLEDGVTIEGDDIGLQARSGLFDQETRSGSFDGGRPVARFSDDSMMSAVQADRIVLQDAPRRVSAVGDVRGWLVLKKKNGTDR